MKPPVAPAQHSSKIIRKRLKRNLPVSLSLIHLLEAHRFGINYPHSLDFPEISATEKYHIKIT
jgi:hypothetical protein